MANNSMWDQVDPNSPRVRELIRAVQTAEAYSVDYDPNAGSWGVMGGSGLFVAHTPTREAATAWVRHAYAREGL